MLRDVEKLSKRQREGTPRPFAEHLLARVRRLFGCRTVAVLWVRRRSIYFDLDGADCWDAGRDARLYAGAHPIIAHPPCGPWGKYHHVSHESREHGRIAMRLVHQWGGVVEHPLGSSLFRECAEPFRGGLEYVEQCRFGHLARKPTLLYWVMPQRAGGGVGGG